MFRISKEVIKIAAGNVSVESNKHDSLSRSVRDMLDLFETQVFTALSEELSFKYIQGAVKASLLFDSACRSTDLENAFLITQHPSYIGDILINKLLSSAHKELHLVFIGDGLREFWLNSHVRFEDVYRGLFNLSLVATVKENFIINCITLEGSSLINVQRINKGAKFPLWQLKPS